MVDNHLVLIKPSSDVVADGTGVMIQLKVRLMEQLLVGLGLAKASVFAKMVVVKLTKERLVRGLREQSFLIED